MKPKSKNENSFIWLEELIASVKTNDFFVVDGPASKLLRRAIRDSSIGVPNCYKSFVLQFGNSKLFRSRLQYLVEVFASPHPAKSESGEDLLQFGKTDESPAYFKVCELQNDGSEIPVYEWNPEDGLHLAYSGFEEWLLENCKIARRQFKKKRWAEILVGPKPFSAEELRVIEARRLFKWRVVGIADDKDLLLEITNGSDIVLPYLTIHVKGKTIGRGGLFVPVSTVLPGHKQVIKKSCYKECEPPDQVELFQDGDPLPENRDGYWEFRPIPAVPNPLHGVVYQAE